MESIDWYVGRQSVASDRVTRWLQRRILAVVVDELRMTGTMRTM